MKSFSVVFLSFFVLLFFFFSTSFVFAQADTGGGPPGSKYQDSGKETSGKVIGIPNPLCPPGQPDCERSSIVGVMNIILGGILWLATPLAVFFIIVAAFNILNSGGDSGKVKEAFEQIKWIAIGYAIILISKSIVSIVIRLIGSPTL